MTNDEVKTLVETSIAGSQVIVQGDGRHFDVVIVSDAFDGLNAVKRQQLVYQAFGDNISNGNIHAVSLQTHTRSEWASTEK